jgi:transcriptional regulator NrdR family protein
VKCPECDADALVLESRNRVKMRRGPTTGSPTATYRRYECFNLHRFSTYEYPVAETARHALNSSNAELSDRAIIEILTKRLKMARNDRA